MVPNAWTDKYTGTEWSAVALLSRRGGGRPALGPGCARLVGGLGAGGDDVVGVAPYELLQWSNRHSKLPTPLVSERSSTIMSWTSLWGRWAETSSQPFQPALGS